MLKLLGGIAATIVGGLIVRSLSDDDDSPQARDTTTTTGGGGSRPGKRLPPVAKPLAVAQGSAEVDHPVSCEQVDSGEGGDIVQLVQRCTLARDTDALLFSLDLLTASKLSVDVRVSVRSSSDCVWTFKGPVSPPSGIAVHPLAGPCARAPALVLKSTTRDGAPAVYGYLRTRGGPRGEPTSYTPAPPGPGASDPHSSYAVTYRVAAVD